MAEYARNIDTVRATADDEVPLAPGDLSVAEMKMIGPTLPDVDHETQSLVSSDAEEEPDSPAVLPATVEKPLPMPVTASAHWNDPDIELDMTVDEVMRYALDHHPVLRARRYEVEVARAKLVSAGLLPNPRLVLDTQSPVHEDDPTELTTRIEFTIPTGGKVRRRKAVAEAGILRAQLAMRWEMEVLLLEVADAATDVVYYQERLLLATELSELAAERARSERSRLEALGADARLADKIEADIDAADMEAKRLEVGTELAVARAVLSRAAGLSHPRPWRIEGRLVVDPTPLLPLGTVLAIARECRPELAEARVALSESRCLHALAHAEAKPDLVMGPRYQDPLGEDADTIGMRFNMDLPLFDRNQGEIQETAAEIQAGRALQKVAELNSLGDVAEAHMELTSLLTSVRFYNTQVTELIERNEALLRDPDVRGGITAPQILDIQQELAKMRLRHLELRYRCHRLVGRLELFLGQRITERREDSGSPEGEVVLPIVMPPE